MNYYPDPYLDRKRRIYNWGWNVLGVLIIALVIIFAVNIRKGANMRPDTQMEVYLAIEGNGGATNQELSKILDWSINRVCPRVKELVSMKMIEDSGNRRINPESGKRNIIWQIKTNNPQMELI